MVEDLEGGEPTIPDFGEPSQGAPSMDPYGPSGPYGNMGPTRGEPMDVSRYAGLEQTGLEYGSWPLRATSVIINAWPGLRFIARYGAEQIRRAQYRGAIHDLGESLKIVSMLQNDPVIGDLIKNELGALEKGGSLRAQLDDVAELLSLVVAGEAMKKAYEREYRETGGRIARIDVKEIEFWREVGERLPALERSLDHLRSYNDIETRRLVELRRQVEIESERARLNALKISGRMTAGFSALASMPFEVVEQSTKNIAEKAKLPAIGAIGGAVVSGFYATGHIPSLQFFPESPAQTILTSVLLVGTGTIGVPLIVRITPDIYRRVSGVVGPAISGFSSRYVRPAVDPLIGKFKKMLGIKEAQSSIPGIYA